MKTELGKKAADEKNAIQADSAADDGSYAVRMCGFAAYVC
jgi:hypothetical protein